MPRFLLRLLLEVADVLVAQRIEYAAVGAVAGAIHGAVRASVDAHAVLLLSVQQANNLKDKLIQPGFRTELRRGDFTDPIPALLNVSDTFDNSVDLLIGLRGLEAAAFARAVSIPFNGTSLRIIGREDFIAMKVFAGGPVDIVDAQAALTAAGPLLDRPLLLRLTRQYGRDASAALDQLLAQQDKG